MPRTCCRAHLVAPQPKTQLPKGTKHCLEKPQAQQHLYKHTVIWQIGLVCPGTHHQLSTLPETRSGRAERSTDLSSIICAAHQISRRRGQICGSAWAQHHGHSRWTNAALPVACAVPLTVHVEHAQLGHWRTCTTACGWSWATIPAGQQPTQLLECSLWTCIVSHLAKDRAQRQAAPAGRPGAPGGADRDQR
jgi:hypothetical protein